MNDLTELKITSAIKSFEEEMKRLGFTIDDVIFYDKLMSQLQSQLLPKEVSETKKEKNKLLAALRSSKCREFCNRMTNEYGVWNHLDLADWLENQ